MGENKIRVIITTILLAVTLFIGAYIILYFSMGLATVPLAILAEYTSMMELLEQYQYIFYFGLSTIMIPSAIIIAINTGKLEEHKFSIARILSFVAIGTIGGILIPIDLGILTYVAGSGALAEGYMGTTMLLQIVQIGLLAASLILVSVKLDY